MKNVFIILILFFACQKLFATIIIVDKNGGGHFTTIQAGITAAVSNDTVKVWPGTYMEQITLNKNIVLMGSGYENTIITGNYNPTLNMSSGIIQWLQVTSLIGNGINLTGGSVRNCVVRSCASVGIYSNAGNPTVINCVIINNGSVGVQAAGSSTLAVINTISRWNSGAGFYRGWNQLGTLNLSYSNGSGDYTSGNQGCFDQDPYFNSNTDVHISEGSPCWNSGNPSLSDPDGSRSDMGYFGGPDCPIYPTVFEIIIQPAGSNVNLKAKARANF